jgi:hypothetical protein
MSYKHSVEEFASEGVPSGVEKESYSPILLNEPFDPRSITINSKVISLEAFLRRIRNGTIRLSPDFQRSSVWNKERQSLLIESMMLRIPLPMFYVAEDKEGNWEVVDGLQRLTAIKDFVLGPNNDGQGYKLEKLEFWGEHFDNKTFSDLENMPNASMTVNNVAETELSFTIIKPDTPEKVKRNIFKRINTGGMPLSEQEIRHALYQGKSTQLLRDIVKRAPYQNILSETINDERMIGRELVLRYFAFYILGVSNYKGDVDEFLSQTMECINEGKIEVNDGNVIISPSLDTLTDHFETAIIRCHHIFGDHVFRKSVKGQRKTPINKSLFDTLMCIFSSLDENDYGKLVRKKDLLLNNYKNLMKDENFGNSISRHSSSVAGVRLRHQILSSFISEFL